MLLLKALIVLAAIVLFFIGALRQSKPLEEKDILNN